MVKQYAQGLWTLSSGCQATVDSQQCLRHSLLAVRNTFPMNSSYLYFCCLEYFDINCM